MEDLSKLSKTELIERLNAQQSLERPESEFQKLERITSRTSANSLPFREHTDHKPVFLWTELNRKIGPFHPDNAKDIMRRWALKGFNLYVAKRSDAEIEAYKASPLGQRRATEKAKKDQVRKNSMADGKVEKFAKEIARETALAVAAIK